MPGVWKYSINLWNEYFPPKKKKQKYGVMLIFTCHGESSHLRCAQGDVSLMGNVSYLGKHHSGENRSIPKHQKEP